MTFADTAFESDFLRKAPAPAADCEATKRVLEKDELSNSNKLVQKTEQEDEHSELSGTREAGPSSLGAEEGEKVAAPRTRAKWWR